MIYLYLLGIAVLMYFSVCFRIGILHPFKTIYYSVRDTIKYFKYKQWRTCKTGHIICYVGLFGKGKTLSAVHKVCSMYKRYNNRMIYDFDRKKWVTQKVNIISNVDLSIPFIPFTAMQQIVDVATNIKTIDDVNDTLTVVRQIR